MHAATAKSMFAQGLGGLADLALARQKDQHIAATGTAFPVQLVAGIDDGVVEVAFFLLLGLLGLHRAVTQLDREHSSRDLDHRRIVEVLREAPGIDRRRSDDQLEIGARIGFALQQLLQIAEQEVDVQAALVRLVENQCVILAEPRVALRFGEQDAVGHQLDVRILRRAVGKADLVTDVAAQLAVQLLRNTRRRRASGDSTRLRMADQAAGAAPEFKTDLGNLRRLARPRFAADDHHLMLFDQFANLGAPRIDRQIVGELRSGQARTPFRDERPRYLQQPVVLGLQGIALRAKQVAQIARHRAQATLVDGEAVLELGFTLQWREIRLGRSSTVSGNLLVIPGQAGQGRILPACLIRHRDTAAIRFPSFRRKPESRRLPAAHSGFREADLQCMKSPV